MNNVTDVTTHLQDAINLMQDTIEEAIKAKDAKKAEAIRAYNEYFEEASARDKTVKGKAASLRKKLGELEAKRVSASTAAIKATVAGDDAAFHKAQEASNRIAAEITATQNLIDQMDTTLVPRDRDLFDACTQAFNAEADAHAEVRRVYSSLRAAASSAITILSVIERNADSYLDRVFFNSSRYDKVEAHYNARANEDRKRAQDEHSAAVEAARKEHPDRIVSTGHGERREVWDLDKGAYVRAGNFDNGPA